MEKPEYGNWSTSTKFIVYLIILLAIFSYPLITNMGILGSVGCWVIALPFLYLTVVSGVVFREFSEKGGNYQNRIHDLVLEKVEPSEGRLLDVGAGSGMLAVNAAKQYPNLKIDAIDTWTNKKKFYSKEQCEKNAKLEGVSDAITFTQASAAKLPFADNTFDSVVSVLTYSEVQDEADKIKVLNESLRVLKKGGQFAWVDVFYRDRIFGHMLPLKAALNARNVEAVHLNTVLAMPQALIGRQVLGYAVLMTGTK